MSFNNIKSKMRSEKGFTIVELLIVIVVIGILAAITIVAYNGVTSRANTTAAAATAATVAKKAEAYNAEKSNYPNSLSLLTATADSGTSFYIPASSLTLVTTAISASNPSATKTTQHVNLEVCGTAATAVSTSAATTTNVTGIKASTWDFSANTRQTVNVGTLTGTSNGYAINCFFALT